MSDGLCIGRDPKELGGLAKEILSGLVTPGSLRALEDEGKWTHDAAVTALAEAGLLGLCLPDEHGGAGLGFLDACIMLRQIGRQVAPVPVLPSVIMAGLPIAQFGTPEQKSAWLPGISSGAHVLTGAFAGVEGGEGMRAEVDGDGVWRISGERQFIPLLSDAVQLVLPAETGSGVALFLLDPNADGAAIASQRAMNHEPWGERTHVVTPFSMRAGSR